MNHDERKARTQAVDISDFPMLTEANRLEAESMARGNVLEREPKPSRGDFADHTPGRFPGYVTGVIFAFILLMFAAGFGPSAFRIYSVSKATFADGSFSEWQGTWVGASFVLLSEIAVVLFSMTAGVLDVSRNMRRTLYGAAFTSALLAIIGNIQVAISYDAATPFDWALAFFKTFGSEPFAGFEAVLPPLFTLLGGLLLKELVLSTIKKRHANEQAYQQALGDWFDRTADITSHPAWLAAKASAIRTIYQREHSTKTVTSNGVKQRVRDGLSNEEWKAIVAREMLQDQWFTQDDLEVHNPVDRPLSSPPPHSNGHKQDLSIWELDQM